MGKSTLPPLERFFNKVYKSDEPNGCWLWTAGRFTTGYGMFYYNGKHVLAHRFSYQQFVGDIPEGYFVCHKCDTPLCVNPDHLFAGTRLENMQDMSRKGRTLAQAHPERLARGDRHGTRTHPERIARGERHGSKTKPERVPRAERHGSQTHPESVLRGEHNPAAKITADVVRAIRYRHAAGGITVQRLADEYGLTRGYTSNIIYRRKWKHIE